MKALLLLLWLLPLWSWAKPEMIRPKVKTSTAFAIVVDRQSYDKVRTAVEAYRDAIEKDGLATWILIDDWESPAEIRALLKELYEDRRMPLEGTVFVGRISILDGSSRWPGKEKINMRFWNVTYGKWYV